MRKLHLTFVGLVAVAAVVGFIAAGNARAGSAGIEVRSQHLSGNELRFIVETYRTWTPLLSHSSKTADAKGYLITIDVGSKKPLAERTTIVGPLWDVPDPRSSISFQAGANFTQEDVNAATATPMCTFDLDGTLLRFTRDAKRNVMVRDALVVTSKNGSWKRQGDVLSVQDALPPMSEDRVLTRSGRYILLFQNGKAECFDLFTGKPRDDAWLTQRFAEARSIANLNNVRVFLTEDLEHLVVSPMAIWNDFPRKTYEAFDFNGKTYRRADVGLAYSRPSEKPLLFKRHMDDQAGFLAEPPHGAFSIKGELFLFASDDATLRLYTPDLQKEIVARASSGVKWESVPFPQIQHAEAANELVMFASNDITARAGPNEIMHVLRWNYVTNKLTQDDAKIIDLFETRGGQLKPKSLVPIVEGASATRAAE